MMNASFTRMMTRYSSGLVCGVLLLLVLALPAYGVAVPDSISAASPVTVHPAAILKATINATVSSATPTVGEPVTISGVATGTSPGSVVQIWVFAGNYINVSTVPVDTDGSFEKTYATDGFPPATYYVFVQNPGYDGNFNIDLADNGIYSGQAVNAQTGALLFNFTGTGSVQDAAASAALTNALNNGDIDDVYTKTTFQLTAPGAAVTQSTAPVNTPLPVPTKSPVGTVTIFAGIGMAGLFCVRAWRR
jgi:hypothetical protein